MMNIKPRVGRRNYQKGGKVEENLNPWTSHVLQNPNREKGFLDERSRRFDPDNPVYRGPKIYDSGDKWDDIVEKI
jgi:hypothetical protein